MSRYVSMVMLSAWALRVGTRTAVDSEGVGGEGRGEVCRGYSLFFPLSVISISVPPPSYPPSLGTSASNIHVRVVKNLLRLPGHLHLFLGVSVRLEELGRKGQREGGKGELK